MVITKNSLNKFRPLLVTNGNDVSQMNIEQKRERLNLAFEWKRIDIVKNIIMKNDQDWKVKYFD